MKHKLYTAWINIDGELPYESGLYLVACKYTTLPNLFYDLANYDAYKDEWITRTGGAVRFWTVLVSLPGNND